MKRILAAVCLVMAAACAGNPGMTLPPAPALPEEQKKSEFQILNHQAGEAGEDLPEWLSRYINEGIAGVESLPQYQGMYVFIEEDAGANINALKQWSLGFTVERDFSRLVSTRIQAHITKAGAGDPDRVYGRFFEHMVKRTFDAGYLGARKEDEYWILKQNVSEDGSGLERPLYVFYILVSVEKDLLKIRLNNILRETADLQVTREQAAAIERLKANFYENF